ncbi:MAG: alpha/beta hydrolase, partial [Bacteroidales bacterium]|nr:alpha/beta hydrolase [Bacteroidales bacterium]
LTRPKRSGKEAYLYGWGPNEAVARSMHEGISGSRWELMEGARHMCFVDRHEDYCRILESWLEEHD